MASEVALGFVAFATALLLVRSFLALVAIQPGFDGSNVLAIDVSLSARDRGWEHAARIFETSLEPELAGLPGVQAVATTNVAPMSLERTQLGRFTTQFGIPGVRFDEDSYPAAQVRWVSEDYFNVLGIPLLQGRMLLQSDRGKPRYLINDSLAMRFFSAEDPVGKHLLIDIGGPQPRSVEVAGVVADVRDLGLDFEVQPTVYSISTSPVFTLLVRSTSPDLQVLAQRVKEVVHRADPDAPVARVRTVDHAVSQSLVNHRFALSLVIGFAGLTALLLVVGIYGVIAYLVSRSAREFGIRAALGCSPADLLLYVIRKGLLVSLIGLGVGFGLSWVSLKLIASVLFDISPTDPLVLATSGIFLLTLCVLSMLIPARRAAIADPAVTLRQD
jgi:putative ABC transport system permease protein